MSTRATKHETISTAESGLAPLGRPPLLQTENRAEFDSLMRGFEQELKPRGIIEKMYVAEIGYITWEMIRLRRCKAAVINLAFFQALNDVLRELPIKPEFSDPDEFEARHGEIEALARNWFTIKEARLEVLRLLKRFQLDESVIEAQAIRNTADDLGRFDFMLTSLENRRDKALRRIAEYRESFAKQVREVADRVVADRVIDAKRDDGAHVFPLQKPRPVARQR